MLYNLSCGDWMNDKQRAEEIKKAIQDLLENWPAHGASPALLARLDDLEETLQHLTDSPAGDEDHPVDDRR